ncbi:MAG TPA: DNA recombination protein RmuC [Negativicutes bacterium]|nr:DNA recombination protein RmuC [Negativicutes bacterium]
MIHWMAMDYAIIFYTFTILGIGTVIFLLLKKKPEEPKKDDGQLLMLQQQINQISQTLDNKLSESNKNQQFQFNQSAKIIGDVRERLAKLDETNRQVVSFADQLKSLQDILKNPKQRGILGEYYLETVLKNVLPPGSYQMQYGFKDGVIVDAAVFVDKLIIPIDSKFSLENYNRMVLASDAQEKKRLEMAFVSDLKLRIDETAKYVKPEEKTTDFAFMFIPSEAVYYDLLINKVGVMAEDHQNLVYYAGRKKVIVVSPTSFLAYLQTVLQGMKNQKISEQAQMIIKEVERLGKHMFTYSEYVNRMGENLDKTVSSYNKARAEFLKVDKDVVKITDGTPQIKINELDRPHIDE